MNIAGSDHGKLTLLRSTQPTISAKMESKKGRRAEKTEKPPTALQSHVAFFDSDNDGVIWPLDTFKGFRAIGFGIFFSLLSMIVIHSGFSYVTYGTWLPDPFFRIRVSLIHHAEHGSDSASYTTTGDLDEHRFNYIFNLYSAPPHTHLSFNEGVRMLQANRDLFDFFGWVASVFEWGSAYLLLWPDDGRVSKEDIHDILDGSLFPRLAAKNAKKAE
ncbi:calcium binding protein Caleosin [Mycena rebaudengoi]|nr:calcium binding protein Caleosin [Mycena rebaudengoi]